MIEIQLDDNYWLTSDSKQYTISEKCTGVDKKGKPYTKFKAKAYLSTLRNALQYYLEISLKKSKAISFEQLISDHETIKNRINKIMDKFESIKSREDDKK